jgi:glycerol-3-phosphate acyltransferase PlsX
MRIVLDAMGSDAAPSVDVEGGVRAARRFGQEIILVGPEDVIRRELARHDTTDLPISIQHASQVIEMEEHPSQAARNKRDASMVVGLKMVREGQADAFVSAGNSGGVLASALISAGRLGRIKGIRRPALATVLPNKDGISFMLDIGANTDCKPEWLVQFALMGAIYAEHVLQIENPRVGLLANGEEATKGNQLVQETYPLLQQMPINFMGNVEGKDIPQGKADVIVSDGFAGNIVIKTAEGVASMLLGQLKSEIKARPLAMVGAMLARPAFKAVSKTLDYREYGGAPLLGVNGVVIVAHGRSDALAIENAVRVAVDSVRADLVDTIRQDVGSTLAMLESVSSKAAD